MPIDYSKYPANWKTEIRPNILKRAGEVREGKKVVSQAKCEFCNAPNNTYVCRGTWLGLDVWQDDNGKIYNADDGVQVGEAYVGDVWGKEQTVVKIILTIAHHNHDITNNDPGNLWALCQRCHNRHDIVHRTANRKETKHKNSGQLKMF